MEIKRWWLSGPIIFLVIFIIPIVYASFFDVFRLGIEDITGRDAVTASISVGNNAPNISDVSLSGQSWAPLEGGVRVIEISFLANDAEGAGNLDNLSAKVNVSYQSLTGAGLLSSSNNSCISANIDSDTINYTCEVSMQYFWDHSTAWTVDAEVNDSNNNPAINSSNANTVDNSSNWTYSELVAANLSDSSLAWTSVAPSDTNASSTTNLTLENTGNSLSLNIASTLIDLGGSGTPYIPAENFSVFNITNTDKFECDFLNQSAAATPGASPLVGVNDTAIRHNTNTMARGGGAGNFGLVNVCLFDVPADLTGGTYNTNSGGSWTIVEEDSGE
ncbi:hypothetical protein HYT56_05430 [Candidatus Woesearchaeota archaeon]|nr:hypothetical protein [Candidatus Woesearchaeota archaeon]